MSFFASYPTGSSGVTTVNGLSGAITLAAGSGISITPSGNTLTIAATGGGGTVTSVAMTVPSFLSVSGSPITTSGTLAVSLSGVALPIANGGTGQTSANAALNAFLPSQGAHAGQFLTTDGSNASWAAAGSGSVTSVALADGSSSPIYSISGSPVTSSGTLTFSLNTQSANLVFAGPTTGSAAEPSFRGLVAADIPSLPYLSSTLTDSHIFVGNASNVATDVPLSGDASLANTGALTLATVNSNVGSFGSSTSIPSFTVNAKGLITAASGNAVIAPAGTLTGTTLASNVVSSSLTSVGTITSGTWNGTTIAIANGGTGQVTANAALNALLPSQGSHSGEFLTTNGTNASWSSGSGVFANTQLSNLNTILPTQINQPLYFGVVGTTTLVGTIETANGTTNASGILNVGTGASSVASGVLNLYSGNSNVGASGNINIQIGNFSTTPGNLLVDSNHGTLTIKSRAANKIILSDTTEGTAGHIWTSTNTSGVGGWAAPAAAAAGTLTGTTLASNVVSSSLTSVGTIASGTWHGSVVAEIYGGTNQSSYSTGDILYASGSNTLSKLSIGSSGDLLTVVAGVPAWAPGSGGGADTALSNLTSPTAINQNLTFDVSNAQIIGQTGGGSITLKSQNNAAGLTGSLFLLTGNYTGGGVTNSGNISLTSGNAGPNGTSGDITLKVGNTGSSGAPGNINLFLGSGGSAPGSSSIALDASSNSGNIGLGTAGGGIIVLSSDTPATIQLQDSTQGTAGQYWSSIDASGTGSWLPLTSPAGNTVSRPGSPVLGQMYFDTDLATGAGMPIWYNGTNWVDATGATV